MTTAHEIPDQIPVLGCIADDVTGATDLATNLVQGGMRVVQVVGIPDTALLSQLSDVDAVVVALKTRSIRAELAVEQSLTALSVLQQMGVSKFYFKYCSTFDSTDHGNIGPVAAALMTQLGTDQTIFCPAFPKAGRTVYRGHLFVAGNLLHESGMQHHPLNPMRDANLLRVLAKQSPCQVGHLSYDHYIRGPAAISQRLQELRDGQTPFVIADACDDGHLQQLAAAVTSIPLVTGGSGLARYLPDAYRAAGILATSEFQPTVPAAIGRSAIVAGSCSTATNGQVQYMRSSCACWSVDVAAVMLDGTAELKRFQEWVPSTKGDETILLTSTAAPDVVSVAQRRFGVEAVAEQVEQFLAAATAMLVAEFGVRRLVLAGGETSGAIVQNLGVRVLRIGPEICTGVPWTETVGTVPSLALALKSGNFGEVDFFQTALEMLL